MFTLADDAEAPTQSGVHLSLSLLCGIDLLTGKVLGRVERRHRSREFIAWLKQADAAYPKDWKIRLIEVFFSKLARTLLRGIRADSPDELKARIEQHLEALNQEPVVFRRKHGRDQITLT